MFVKEMWTYFIHACILLPLLSGGKKNSNCDKGRNPQTCGTQTTTKTTSVTTRSTVMPTASLTEISSASRMFSLTTATATSTTFSSWPSKFGTGTGKTTGIGSKTTSKPSTSTWAQPSSTEYTSLLHTSTASKTSVVTSNVGPTVESISTVSTANAATDTTTGAADTPGYGALGQDPGDAVLVLASVIPLIVFITIVLLLVYRRQEVIKLCNSVVGKVRLNDSAGPSFHNAAYQATYVMSTDGGYAGIPLGSVDHRATNDLESVYHTIDIVPDTECNLRNEYGRLRMKPMPNLNTCNTYAHLKSNFSKTNDTEYAHTNTHLTGMTSEENKRRECYDTLKASNIPLKPKRDLQSITEKSLNKEDLLYSHTVIDKDRNGSRIQDTDNYSHMEVGSVPNTRFAEQKWKKTEAVNEGLKKKKAIYLDIVIESKYSEAPHEYSVLEKLSIENKEKKKTSDTGESKSAREKKSGQDGSTELKDEDDEEETTHDYFILEAHSLEKKVENKPVGTSQEKEDSNKKTKAARLRLSDTNKDKENDITHEYFILEPQSTVKNNF